MTKEETIAYLAGFFDGEGCIRVAENRAGMKHGYSPVHRLVIVASQRTDRSEPLVLLRETFGGCICKTSVRTGCRPCSQWVISGKKAQEVLRQMMPFLLVKKIPAMAAMAFQEWKAANHLLRKSRTKMSDAEIALNHEFVKLFSMLNGNKPLSEEENLPPVKSEEEVPIVDRIN